MWIMVEVFLRPNISRHFIFKVISMYMNETYIESLKRLERLFKSPPKLIK